MRWLKHLLSVGLVLAAAGIALATGLSDHTHDYGQVAIPQGGVVDLPHGTVVVYYKPPGDGSNPIQQVSVPFSFQVVPVGGGPPVPIASNGNQQNVVAFQRSETIGELGAVAKLHVPTSGEYAVDASADAAPGTTYLKFGTNAGAAVLAKWKLFAGLLLGAFLLAVLPLPKPKRHWDEEVGPPRGWSSDSRAPYAG
jgi:hypothetical protein